MQRYCILEREIGESEDGFPAVISRAYLLREKPLCLCRRDEKLPLYISLRHGAHVLSRWPGTGARHAAECDHYEAPDFLTGLGQVKGSAIVENPDSGEVDLRFSFPLSRGPARAAPSAVTNDKSAVKTNGQRLTMRGLLHFLWDRAQLTHWHPKMAGKRNWFVVRRALMNAALTCKARGTNFAPSLFIPETLSIDRKDEIAMRRRSELAPLHASRDAIMVVIGEIKTIEEARFGEKIVLRHLPDWPFMLDRDMAIRFHKRFAAEEQLWNAEGPRAHLIMAGSFGLSQSGLPEVIEASIMPVTEQWLPFETLDDQALIAKAVSDGRRFVKGLRLNLGSDVPIASMALTDTGGTATAVFLEQHHVDADYDKALTALMASPGVEHATWAPGQTLPPARPRSDPPTHRANSTIR